MRRVCEERQGARGGRGREVFIGEGKRRLDSGRCKSWAADVEGHVVGLYTRLGSAWAYRSWDQAQSWVKVSGIVFFFPCQMTL
jgi:hypothetical protein